MGALRVGSIPGTGDFFCSYFLYDDDGGATRSGADERERRYDYLRNERSEFRR